MRNKLFYSALFLLFFMPFALAGDITVFEATVYGSVVSVEVPDIIYLGNISSGFVGEEKRVDIVNTGTTDIIITPILIGDHDPIFEKLYFSKRLSGVDYSFRQVGNFSLNMSKPSRLGGTNNDYFYTRMDLSDYTGSVPSGVSTLRANVKFVATSG
ncbi:hypothetical protein J4461_03650 [Candidatus Pacearchaeota archaeon]|nr:hypothetical protein [uncultured archaeon]AQS34031.1 hypothetical protein [uncultured archaeon]AQS34080.1 hypothetical protein [uncultured archaeon]MBS3089945.1 hypothetical protein [Candidatus Pacearchaeota archaeon]